MSPRWLRETQSDHVIKFRQTSAGYVNIRGYVHTSDKIINVYVCELNVGRKKKTT